jgi:hypothetical protein
MVGELGGKAYLYDIEDILDLNGSTTPGPPTDHYGWFFTDPPVSTYETQKTLSDDHPNGVWGCEVVQESWVDGNGDPQSETYVYFGVPRIGVEVAKLNFNSSGTPSLDYLGRIRTPGVVAWVQVEEFSSPLAGGHKKLLYVADYNGGMRIYGQPTAGN